MIRREGRVDNPQPESARVIGRVSKPKPIVVRQWEKPIFVLALIIILVLGGIAAMNSLIALFPH